MSQSGDQLFQTEPVVGEKWQRPGDDGQPLVIERVWKHHLYNDEVWVSASRKSGDWLSTSGSLSSFLARGYVRVG